MSSAAQGTSTMTTMALDAPATRDASAFYRLLWAFPIAFVLHIAEEAPAFSSWVEHTLGGEISLGAFAVNNAGFMVVLVALVVLAVRVQKPWATALLFFWVSGQQFWNFVFHLYTQILFGDYSPGIVTAVLLYYPTYLFIAGRAVRERHVSPGVMALAFVAGAVGMVTTIWIGLYHCGPMPETWLPEALR
jgi:hypothetical protein